MGAFDYGPLEDARRSAPTCRHAMKRDSPNEILGFLEPIDQ